MEDSPYERIAELFGAPKFEEGDPETSPRRRKGRTAEESQELGRLCLSEGDYQTAIKHFQRAVEQGEGRHIAARVDLAGAYEYAEMAPQAFRQYETALKAQKDAPEPHVGLSQIYKRYARYRDSLEELQKAIELEPNNAFFHFKLAEIFREIGERERAVAAIQGAVSVAPQEPFYHYWHGDLLIEMGCFDKALDALRAAIELSPGDDFLYLRASAAFWGADRKPEALKAIRIASDLDPSKHLYYGILQMFLERSGQLEEAALENKRVSKMDAYDREVLRRFADEIGLSA
jgi:tetratricopeptide (TPR) repeat protein